MKPAPKPANLPKEAQQLVEKGKSYFKSENYKDAIATFTKAVKLDPNNAEAHMGLGIIHLIFKDKTSAQKEYEVLKTLSKERADKLFLLIEKLYARPSPQPTNPPLTAKDAQRLTERGKDYFQNDRYPEAINAFKQANRITPKAEAYLGLALIYSITGRYQDSISAYQAAIQLKPEDALSYTGLCYAYEQLGRYQDSINASKEAVSLKPDFAEAHFYLGKAYTKLGQYQQAIEPLKNAIRFKPDLVEAYIKLGMSYAKLGLHQESVKTFKQAAALKPNDPDIHLNLGIEYLKLFNKVSAIQEYEKLKKLDTGKAGKLLSYISIAKDEKYYIEKGKVYFKNNRYQEAIDAFKTAIAINPNDPDAHMSLAIVYSMMKDKAAALSEYEIYRKLNAEQNSKLLNLIENLKKPEKKTVSPQPIELKGFSTPIPATTRIPAGLKDATKYVERGKAYFVNNRYDDAIEAFKQAIRLSPNDPDAHLGLGVVYAIVKDRPSAVKEYDVLRNIDSTKAAKLYNLISKLQTPEERNTYSPAPAEREEPKVLPWQQQPAPSIAQPRSSDARTFVEEGKSSFKSNRHQEAILSFKRALAVKPDEEEAYMGLGLVYSVLGRNQESVDAYKAAIRINPNDALAYTGLGWVYGLLGRSQDSIDALRIAIYLKPDFAEAHFYLGTTYEKSGRFQEAVESYKQAIRLKPGFTMAYLNLGNTYEKLGSTLEAIEAFKQAVILKPDDADVQLKLGTMYAKTGDKTLALSVYKSLKILNAEKAGKLYNIINGKQEKPGKRQPVLPSPTPEPMETYSPSMTSPENATSGQGDRSYIEKGKYYIKNELYQDAINVYKEATSQNPRDAEAYLYLGEVYDRLGRYQASVDAYKEAINIKPDYPAAYVNLGITYSKLGLDEEAIGTLEKSIGLKPETTEDQLSMAEAYLTLGKLYANQGRYRKAIDSYKQTIAIKPDHADAYLYLGIAYNEIGYKKEAILAFNQVIRINPNSAEAHMNLGIVSLSMGNEAGARNEYEALTRIDNEQAERLLRLINKQFPPSLDR